jgi:hypothetical protein
MIFLVARSSHGIIAERDDQAIGKKILLIQKWSHSRISLKRYGWHTSFDIWFLKEGSGLLGNFFPDAAIRPETENGRWISHISAAWLNLFASYCSSPSN